MKIVLQRVKDASCQVDGKIVAAVSHGLLVYVGFAPADGVAAVDWMIDRVYKMRIFEDENGKMNRSVQDMGLDVMWIPNFTLYCDTRSRRPSFSTAMAPAEARPLFDYLCGAVAKYTQKTVQCGIFGADMQIQSVCDGPINVVVES